MFFSIAASEKIGCIHLNLDAISWSAMCGTRGIDTAVVALVFSTGSRIWHKPPQGPQQATPTVFG